MGRKVASNLISKVDKDSCDAEYDAIVVGAGIIGSACAYYLARSGQNTLLLEQFALRHANGSSHGASRIIRHTHSSEVYVPLSVDAYREWNELETLTGQQLYTRNGLLWLCDNLTETMVRSDLLRKYSIPHEVLNGNEIRVRFPHLHYDHYGDCVNGDAAGVEAAKWSAVWEPSGGTMLADKCLLTFHKLAENSPNCTICANECVTKIIGGDKTVALLTKSGRTFSARRVVITAGAWLGKLFADLPLRIVPQRVSVNFWRSQTTRARYQRTDASPNLIITQQSDDTEMFMIPCTDYCDKVKFGIHLSVDKCDPDSKVASSSEMPMFLRGLLSKHISAHLPDIDASQPAIEDKCFYSMTGDHNFIVDHHPSNAKVIIAGGMSGTGFKFAPIIAKIVTKMTICDNLNSAPPISEFRLNRHIPQAILCKL